MKIMLTVKILKLDRPTSKVKGCHANRVPRFVIVRCIVPRTAVRLILVEFCTTVLAFLPFLPRPHVRDVRRQVVHGVVDEGAIRKPDDSEKSTENVEDDTHGGGEMHLTGQGRVGR